MKNLKRLGVSVTLVCLLAMAAFAGETNSPPCAPPAPGQTETMPCTSPQMTPDNSTAQGGTNAPPAANDGNALSVTEVAIDLLQSVLSIF